MKKLIIILAAVCLLFAGVIGYTTMSAPPRTETPADTAPDAVAAPEEAVTQPAAQASAEPVAVKTLDYEALYALHQPDEVVMTVGGQDITWDEYFAWLYMNGKQVENYFTSMASYYGMALNWSDPVGDDPEETYAKYVTDGVDSTLLNFVTIQGLADENGLVLSQESLDAIEAQKQNDIVSICGEGATEEDFQAALKEMYMTESAYERMTDVNYVYQENFTNLYGKDGAEVTEEQALGYLEDNGYLCANHILLMTVDPSTGEALEPSVVAEKKATAEKLYGELSGISDPAALEKRFKELKEENCQDTGKASYPDGYVFQSGTMTEVFETTVTELDDYGLSEPVESEYGYHIILRLPQDADRTVSYSDAGTALSARSLYANEAYAKTLEDYMAKLTVDYAPDFKAPNLLDYLK